MHEYTYFAEFGGLMNSVMRKKRQTPNSSVLSKLTLKVSMDTTYCYPNPTSALHHINLK